MNCPRCGTGSTGNFCPTCGAALAGDREPAAARRTPSCAGCGANLVPAARFCTRCGAAADADGQPARARHRPNLPWYIAGGALAILLAVLLLPDFSSGPDRGGSVSPAPFAAPGTAPGTPPPLTGTPREQADRLFNRIMTAHQEGDTASTRFFAPMAVQAYAAAQPLDNDGLYHLATIHIVAGDYDAARQTADRILEREANHLLGLAAAAEAAARAGDPAAARGFYRRFLDAYDTEIERGLQEYRDHQPLLPDVRAEALRVTG